MWTRIKLTHEETLPPLHEPVMLFAEESGYRWWTEFHDELHRASVLLKSWTHWRRETDGDSP